MSEEKKEEKKEEEKYPQISSELRGEYKVYTKDKGIYTWTFPYNTQFENSIEAIEVLKNLIQETIKQKKEQIKKAKEAEEAKKAQEVKTEIPIETKIKI